MSVPMDQREGLIWQNGNYVDWQEAQLHLLSHGLHYGSGVFEGTRVYNGKIFKLREHTERLFNSAKVMDMKIPYSLDELEQVQIDILKKNNIVDGYLRPIAWRGSETIAVSAQDSKIHTAIAAWEWPSYFSPEARARGLRLTSNCYRRPAPDAAPWEAKASGLYMICTLSKHHANAAGFDDALMLDHEGYVAESTGSNFFLIIDGELHTPIADRFLNGITRQTVMALAADLGINVVERRIKPDELKLGQEAFVTGTAAEVTPIASIDEIQYTVGPVVKKLMAAYEAFVRA